VWHVRSGKEISRLFDPSPISFADFSFDGRWVVAFAGEYVGIWNAANGNGVASVPNESDRLEILLEPTAVTSTTDGQHLVVATGDRVSFWEAR